MRRLRIHCIARDCALCVCAVWICIHCDTQHSRMNSFVSFKKLCKFPCLKMLHAKNTTISGDVQPSKCSPFEWMLPLSVDICYLCWNNANANLLYRTWRNLIFYIVTLPSSPSLLQNLSLALALSVCEFIYTSAHIVCYSLNSVSHNMCEWKPNYVHHINWCTLTHTPLSVEEWQTILVERSMQDSVNFGIALVAWKRRRSHSTPANLFVWL